MKKIFEGRTRPFRLSALHTPAAPLRSILPLCFNVLRPCDVRRMCVSRVNYTQTSAKCAIFTLNSLIFKKLRVLTSLLTFNFNNVKNIPEISLFQHVCFMPANIRVFHVICKNLTRFFLLDRSGRVLIACSQCVGFMQAVLFYPVFHALNFNTKYLVISGLIRNFAL